MTCDKNALNSEICKEGQIVSHAVEGLFEPPSPNDLRLRFMRMELHSAEPHHQISGEATTGVGSQRCDHETSAWHPHFVSMNYALLRLTKADK